jgi:hypothetical protein
MDSSQFTSRRANNEGMYSRVIVLVAGRAKETFSFGIVCCLNQGISVYFLSTKKERRGGGGVGRTGKDRLAWLENSSV